MTLEQLRIFVAVAERTHMTRAAEALGLTQSAASAGVAALEARYGVKLFDRVGRGLVLSEAGKVFLPEAKAVLARAADAAQALDDLAGLRRGRVAMAASQTVASYWLPPRLARFAAAHPGVELSLAVGNTATVAEAVQEGAADLGFVEGVVDAPALARAPLASDRIGLYAAPANPLAGRPLGLDELRSARWAMREAGSGTRSAFEAALAAKGFDPGSLDIVLELPSNEAVLAAVEGGALVTAVSDLAAAAHLSAGRVARLRFDLPAREFGVLSHRERRRSAAAAALLESIRRPGT